MKRFTDTNKWSDPWFQDLTPELKLLWLYICDNCDCAGIWQVNMKLAEFCLGWAYPKDTLPGAFGDRVREIGDGKIWICKFCGFQYGQLSADCPPHRNVIQRLAVFSLTDDNKLKSLPYSYPKLRVQEKEKEKEKETKGGAGGKNETAEMIRNQNELGRVEAEIKRLQANASQDAMGTRLYSKPEKEKLKTLRARQTELKNLLGFKA